MRDEHIDEMVRLLKSVLKDADKAKVILQRYWRTKMALVWEVEDVHRAANERKRALTNTEAIAVLQTLHDQHNSQLGIKWEDLWAHIDLYEPGRVMTKAELDRFVKLNIIAVAK
jgi:hypothetical protein